MLHLPPWLPALLLVSLVVAVPQAEKPTGRGSKNGDTKTHPDSQRSFKNKLGMTLVRIRAGDFKMGSTKDEQDAVLKSVDPKFKKYVRDWLAGWDHISLPKLTSVVRISSKKVMSRAASYRLDRMLPLAGCRFSSPKANRRNRAKFSPP